MDTVTGAVRGAQFVFAAITLGLTASVLHDFHSGAAYSTGGNDNEDNDSNGYGQSEITLLLSSSAIGLAALIFYLIPSKTILRQIQSRAGSVTVDVLVAVLFLAGFIATAVKFSGSVLGLTGAVVRQAQASSGFGGASWASHSYTAFSDARKRNATKSSAV